MAKELWTALGVIAVVLALGTVYVGHQAISTATQLDELRSDFDRVIAPLKARISELENLLVTVEVTIDYGGADNLAPKTETVHLTRGATALEAFRRVAVVETRFYKGLGEYVVSIDGVSENPAANKFWMWYLWDEAKGAWELAPVGAGNHKLEDGEKIKFSYEIVVW